MADNIDYKKKYEHLKSLLDSAYAVYNKGGRASVRNAAVCKALGFSTGKRQAKIKSGTLISEYRILLERSNKTKRAMQEIIDDMKKRHGFQSAGALHKHLRDEIALHKNAIINIYTERGYDFDEKTMWFSNILPPHK